MKRHHNKGEDNAMGMAAWQHKGQLERKEDKSGGETMMAMAKVRTRGGQKIFNHKKSIELNQN